uniref:Uncharacterized protein n=1 Tax=Heterosigma akashiwo TaxID=2829 RepID=A0A7S4DCS5_HETAK
METVPEEQQTGNAGGASNYEGLLRMDATWKAIRNMKEGAAAGPAPVFVRERRGEAWGGGPTEYDVVVAGGTLGVFQACALQLAGLKVAVVERGPLRGRNQDWNIARKELWGLVRAGVLSEEEAEAAISIEFNPMRAGFKLGEDDPDGFEVYMDDVLNLGVSAVKLVEAAAARFRAAGGTVLEFAATTGITVYDNAAVLTLEGSGGDEIVREVGTKLVLDCMGMASPIVRQLRHGQKPDGVCLVVGSCGRGYPEENNKSGDIIYANTPVMEKESGSSVQYFWEAFPAGTGPTDRTTYMFTYMDAHPDRPSVRELFDDYWELLPKYQGLAAEDQQLLRVLYGLFLTYKDSPLRPGFDRVLQIGDASGIQSPLSFGGFVCLTRHIGRLTGALADCVRLDRLSREDLALVNAYQPNLSGAWMFQKAMSVAVGQRAAPGIVVRTLQNNFGAMNSFGDPVLRPFLQDVVQFDLLLKTLVQAFILDPLAVPPLLFHVGLPALIDWMGHFAQLWWYSTLYNLIGRGKEAELVAAADNEGGAAAAAERFAWARRVEAWKYGSGLDYEYHAPPPPLSSSSTSVAAAREEKQRQQ